MKKTAKPKLLVERDSPVLREVARAVKVEEILSEKIASVIESMKQALHREEDGVAIAAPQIGVGLRIFVVNGAILSVNSKKPKGEAAPTDLVFVNPEIVKVSRKKRKMEEGCLSLRYLYGQVSRHEKITITALDESGLQKTFGASGLLAQIFQHEIDHLNGVLFIDKAEDVKDLPPEHDGTQ